MSSEHWKAHAAIACTRRSLGARRRAVPVEPGLGRCADGSPTERADSCEVDTGRFHTRIPSVQTCLMRPVFGARRRVCNGPVAGRQTLQSKHRGYTARFCVQRTTVRCTHIAQKRRKCSVCSPLYQQSPRSCRCRRTPCWFPSTQVDGTIFQFRRGFRTEMAGGVLMSSVRAWCLALVGLLSFSCPRIAVFWHLGGG